MKIRTFKLILLLFLFITVTYGCISKLQIPFHKKNKTNEIELKMESKKRTLSLSANEYPDIKISINNFTKDTIWIVQPGDGSKVGWRTPIIKWSVIRIEEEKGHPNKISDLKEGGIITRCGNMNNLKKDEIVRLRPNYGVKLEWTGLPPIPRKEGKYSIKFYYKNDPTIKWKDEYEIKYNDQEAMEFIKNETKEFELVSNEVIIELKK